MYADEASLPEGYNTVRGYLAATNPEALSLMDMWEDVVEPDEVWCAARCEALGLSTTRYQGSPAFPVAVLSERLD